MKIETLQNIVMAGNISGRNGWGRPREMILNGFRQVAWWNIVNRIDPECSGQIFEKTSTHISFNEAFNNEDDECKMFMKAPLCVVIKSFSSCLLADIKAQALQLFGEIASVYLSQDQLGIVDTKINTVQLHTLISERLLPLWVDYHLKEASYV